MIYLPLEIAADTKRLFRHYILMKILHYQSLLFFTRYTWEIIIWLGKIWTTSMAQQQIAKLSK